MASITIENYLKQILLLSDELANERVPMGKLAERMQVVPGTATTMVKAMDRSGWLNYIPREGVSLTEEGNQLALKVLRKHRVVEMFLVEALKLDWSEIHQEAEALEHAISDKVLDRMDEYLGRPAYDPHGDPIPTRLGEIKARKLQALSECQKGQTVRIAQIKQQDARFLQFLDRTGLTPGSTIRVLDHDATADLHQLETVPDGRKMHLGGKAAESIWVSPKG
ncbi:MAG: metal-dependent transcriptional regulator [Opitutales bacterium]|nr:metal-dependent transcriptional regulator [Opitutales bacterium]